MWRLLLGEAAHLGRAAVASPAVAVMLAGAVASAGVHVALGPGYPGPVAPVVARWSLAALVLAASLGVARTTPRRWRGIRRMVRRARIGLTLVAAAATVSLVKVGFHDVTPGPVLPAPIRWTLVAMTAMAALALAAGPDHRSDP